MSTFLSVLLDLYHHLISEIGLTFNLENRKREKEVAVEPSVGISTINAVDRQLSQPLNYLFVTHDVHFVRVRQARVYLRPVSSYDGVREKVPLGTSFEVLSFTGRFAEVKWLDGTAWVLKDDLTPWREEVYPQFVDGQVYEANNDEVQKLRRLIHDEFSTKDLYLPLQDTELVYYCLMMRNRFLPWDDRRPRLSGKWHEFLRGKPGINIGVNPKSHGVMEYVKDSGEGVLAFVREVRADDSVMIESVGVGKEGEYCLQILKREDWQKLRPVWIGFL